MLVRNGPIAQPLGRMAAMHGLLDSSFELIVEDRWEMGFTFLPEIDYDAGTVELCTGLPVGQSSLPDRTGPAVVEYYPFGIEIDVVCPSRGFQTADYVGRARRAIELAQSKAAEAEFWLGTSSPLDGATKLNQNLVGDGAMIAAGTTNTLDALGVFTEYLADQGQAARGMIHVSPRLALRWVEAGMVVREGRRLVTVVRGDIVVAGAGYAGTGPTGQAAPGASEEYGFVTGLVYSKLGDVEITPSTLGEAIDRNTNVVQYRASRTAAVVHDNTVQPGALKIDVTFA